MKIDPIINTPITTIKKATNFNEKFQYTKVMAESFHFSEKISNLRIWLITLLGCNRNTRVLKDNRGQIVGGYQYKINYKGELTDMYIDTLVVKKKKSNNYSKLKLITQDIKTMAEKNRIDLITMIVQKDKPALINMYKKFGFKEANLNMLFFKKMFIKVSDFKAFSSNA